MAISRMQQPRQMYGLGSFVKKAVRKVTRPFTKVAKKIVPKEIAGIMRIAAPFLGPVAGPAAYLLGTAKQTGRISPIDLALASIPKLSKLNVDKTGIQKFLPESLQGYDTLGETVRAVGLPMTDKTVGDVLLGDSGDAGIFGSYGDPVNIFNPDSPSFRETSTFQKLLGKKDKPEEFDLLKTGAFGVGVLSFIKDSKTPKEAGDALVAQTGNPEDYERGVQLFSQLKPELFEVPERFRMNVKDGGRIGFQGGTGPRGSVPGSMAGLRSSVPEIMAGPKMGLGSLGEMKDKPFKFDAQEFMINKYKEDGTKPNIIGEGFQGDDKIFVIETPNFGTMLITLDQYLENFGVPERKITKKDGGIMRTNYARGSDDDDKPVLPDDPTEPINPFGPKPIKPLGDMKMASSDRYQRILEQLINELEGRLGRELTNAEYDMVSKEAYDRLSDPDFAVGGRVDYALGTRPTAEESGLGGLPIEADMRYTGGFMPYGAKEKADDVPARLSKNEFVFTADAVRAAGGGSVNEGAKKMYQAMKQLEAKPEAKGMMA